MRDILYSYAKLKELCARQRESIADYIKRAQIVYDNIIEVEKSEKGFLTDSDVTKINGRFVHAFYWRRADIGREMKRPQTMKCMKWLKRLRS
jgi:hypothetical protein